MSEEFEIEQLQTNFDFKGFLLKLLAYWPLFLVSLIIAFGIAHYINVRKLPVYRMGSLISIKDDQNPFFTSNTSLTFNWGGTTDKVNTAIVTLKTRSHNEKVVQRLQYFTQYLKQGKYQLENAYKQTPFQVEADTSKPQVLNHLIGVSVSSDSTFVLQATFTDKSYATQTYASLERGSVQMPEENFQREFRFGERIVLPFFNGVIHNNPNVSPSDTEFYFRFANLDGVVSRFRGLNVQPESNGSSVLNLSLTGNNKAELVDYLNATVKVLGEDVLARKNLFATKTIRFIDSTLAIKSDELAAVQSELDTFRTSSTNFDLGIEGQEINSRLSSMDLQKDQLEEELGYYITLEEYLNTRTDYSDVPAPSVAGINEESIVAGVGKITALAEERSKYKYTFKNDAPVFADIDRQINAVKSVLLENISSSKSQKSKQLKALDAEIAEVEAEIRKLPKEQQQLLNIQRRYDLSAEAYNMFLSKRSEAGMVKAANVSDVMVIDSAKDIGGGQVGPNTQLNYIMAGLFGFFIPFVGVFFIVFFDNKIHTPKDIERLSPIPVLGVVGRYPKPDNLAVLNNPNSAIAESFRGIRSSLQFIYKKRGIKGAKTVLITSSIAGEGKTFCSINIASVLALSEKRTILIGLDLRRPKIFDDFKISNKVGVVNYLIDDEPTLDKVIQKTKVPHLDILTSGPVPPNPSELLLGERMETMMEELSQRYDYIILDSPPLGLVADSLELTRYADAALYIVRHKYTRKGMLSVINEKYKSEELKHVSYVLNYYQPRGGYGYGYGFAKYGNGYYASEKKIPFWKRIFRK